MWWFPKIRGTILGVPTKRTVVFWGLYWGSLVLGNYHVFRNYLLISAVIILFIVGYPTGPSRMIVSRAMGPVLSTYPKP